jgi:hypothetical protein
MRLHWSDFVRLLQDFRFHVVVDRPDMESSQALLQRKAQVGSQSNVVVVAKPLVSIDAGVDRDAYKLLRGLIIVRHKVREITLRDGQAFK